MSSVIAVLILMLTANVAPLLLKIFRRTSFDTVIHMRQRALNPRILQKISSGSARIFGVAASSGGWSVDMALEKCVRECDAEARLLKPDWRYFGPNLFWAKSILGEFHSLQTFSLQRHKRYRICNLFWHDKLIILEIFATEINSDELIHLAKHTQFCVKSRIDLYLCHYSVAKDRNPRYLVFYAFSITHVFYSNLLNCT